MRALVIDDSRTMRKILARILEGGGFEVDQAENGRDGLERLAAIGQVDLILVDWNMPEMNGLEFVREARSNPSWSSVPIVMVTTETEVSQMTKALEAGANEYIMKPFTQEILVEKLQLIGVEV